MMGDPMALRKLRQQEEEAGAGWQVLLQGGPGPHLGSILASHHRRGRWAT